MKNYNVSNIFCISFLISLATLFCYGDETQKPTLIIFSANWCSVCKTAKQDINNDYNLSEIIKKYLVVTADYDVDKDLVEGYNITRLPTFVLINKTNITKKIGYEGPKDLIKFLK